MLSFLTYEYVDSPNRVGMQVISSFLADNQRLVGIFDGIRIYEFFGMCFWLRRRWGRCTEDKGIQADG